MKEIRRRVALLARVVTLVLAPSAGQPSARSFRGLRYPSLSTASGSLSPSNLVSDAKTHGGTRPVLAPVSPG